VHALSLVSQLPMRHALGKARAEWISEQPEAATAPEAQRVTAAVTGGRTSSGAARGWPRQWADRALRFTTRVWAIGMAMAVGAAQSSGGPGGIGDLVERMGDWVESLLWGVAVFSVGLFGGRIRSLLARPGLARRAVRPLRLALVGAAVVAAVALQLAIAD
jgi:hypothetical protein